MNQTNQQQTDLTPLSPAETMRHSVFLADTRQVVNTTLRRAEEIRYAADIELAGRSRDNYFALERMDTSVPDMTRSAFGQASKAVFGTGANMVLTLYRELKAGAESAKLAWEKSGEVRAVTDALRMGTMAPERANRELAGIDARYEKLKSLGRDAMQVMRANHERFLQESGLAKDEQDGFVYDFFGGIATLGAAVAVTAITKSPVAASALFGAYAGRQDYEEALASGVTPGRAMLVGFAGGLAEGGLEHLGLGALEKVFKGKGILRAGLKGFTTEAVQEGSQQTAEEIIMQTFGGREKELQDTFVDITYSALLGGLTGAPVSVIMNFAQKRFEEKGADAQTAQKLAKIAVEHAGSPAVQQTAHNVLSNLTSALNYPDADVAKGAKEFGEAVRKSQDRNVRRAVYNVAERTEQNARAAGYDPVTAELLGQLEQSRANSIYALAGITPGAQMDLTEVRFEKITPQQPQEDLTAARKQWKREYEEQQARRRQEEQAADKRLEQALNEQGLTEEDFFFQENAYQNGKADTHTPQFKKWFGNSKVVDEKGAPLVVYHGTKTNFDTFMPSKDGALGQGMYFVSSKEYAQGVGKNVMPVYLSIKNPYIANGPITGDAAEFTNKLKQQGYDGVIHPENGFYVAFEPTQIKSVYNRGTFDALNPNIFYQTSQNNQNPSFAEELDGILKANTNKVAKAVIGKVSAQLSVVAKKHGLNIDGYTHDIDSSGIQHTRKRHGIALREERQGQLAVTDKDFKNIPQIIYNPDFVAFGAKNKKGLDIIIYGKNMQDGSSVYVEEVRTGRKTLTTNSLRKYKTGVNPSSFAKRISNAHGDTGTISIAPKEEIFKGHTFYQGPRGSITFDNNANTAVIRAFSAADRSTALHEFAHLWSRDLFRFENVSREEDFLQLLKDIRDWRAVQYAEVVGFIRKTGLLAQETKSEILAQIQARGGEEYVRRLAYTDELDAQDFTAGFVRRAFEEHFAESFEAYVMRGKAPSARYESLFVKFARWLRELYDTVAGKVEISPAVQSIFDRMMTREAARVDSNLFTGKVEQIKKLVQNIRTGKPEADGAPSLQDFKGLLEMLDAPAPRRPQTHLLKELRRRGAEYNNAGQIDKEAYKNARVYDKKGGVDDRPDVWLQKLGYMDFDETTPETLAEAYDKIQRALDGEEIYPLGAEAQLAEWNNYKAGIDVLKEVFGGNVREIRATLRAILDLESKGYRVVEKKDLKHMSLRLDELSRLAGRLELKTKTAQDKSAADKKTLEAARKIKRNIISELEKRQVQGKGEMVKKLHNAKSFEEIHTAAADALDFLRAAYDQTAEGRAEISRLAVPNTDWDGVKVELLQKYNEVISSADEKLKQAWQTLDEISVLAAQGKILDEAQARAKENAERTVRELGERLDGQYVQAMENTLRNIPHLSPQDVRKFLASYAKKATRYRALNQSQVENFIQTAKNVQEANYKKYMRGKIGAVLSRKTFEKVGTARRAKYTPEALAFLQSAAGTWHGTQESALAAYEQAVGEIDPNNPPSVWKALENRVLWAKADPGGEVSMADLRALYDDALSAVRGDRAFKRLEGVRQAVHEDNLRLAAELSLKDRKLPKGTAAYLLHGGVDLQTFLSICFGKYEVDEFEEQEENEQKRTGANGQVSTDSAATQTPPTFSRQDLGAVLNNSIAENKDVFKDLPSVDDYRNPKQDYTLPALADETAAKIGVENKPVLLKKNIIEKNKSHHPEVDIAEYNDILAGALYDSDYILQVQKQAKPNYFTFVKENGGKVTVLEVNAGKESFEVVSFFKVDKKRIETYKNKTIREGGEILITKGENSQGAARLSALADSSNSIAENKDVFKPQTKTREIDFREELAPETNQIEQANFKDQAQLDILRAIGTAYGLKSPFQIIDKIAEMKKDTVELINYAYVKDQENGETVATLFKNGKPLTHNKPRKQTVNRLEALTFWIWNQDHDFVQTAAGNEDYGLSGRLQYAYGTAQLENLFGRLTPQDIQAAKNLQKLADKHYAEESLVHQRIYGFPLPKKEFYFPSVTDRVTDAIDTKQEFVQNSKAPSFIKQRVKNKRVIQQVTDPVELLRKHLDRAGEFIYNAEKYTELLRVFKQSSMETAFIEAFGETDGKKVYAKLLALVNQQAPQTNPVKNEFYKLMNKLLNGWVKAVMGLKPITGIKQFASSVSFAEHMPWSDWAKWFAEGLSHPLETADYMKRLSPYIQTRYNSGAINENILRAMQADEISPIAVRWDSLTNLMLLNTRLGDKASLIYGGYPYMKYLIDVKKLTPEAAARQFEKQATRTLQSSLRVHLSEGQANADSFGARVFLMFKNQQLQYVRKAAESYVAYKNGEISAAQMAKTAFIYLVLNPMVYTILGLGFFAANGDDWGEDLKRLLTSPVSQFFGAYPFGEGVADFFMDNAVSVWKDQKLTVPQKMGLPMFDDIYKDVARMVKTVNADDIAVTDFLPVFLDAAKYTGLPTQTFANMAGGAADLVHGKFARGGLRLAGYTKNRAGKITGEEE